MQIRFWPFKPGFQIHASTRPGCELHYEPDQPNNYLVGVLDSGLLLPDNSSRSKALSRNEFGRVAIKLLERVRKRGRARERHTKYTHTHTQTFVCLSLYECIYTYIYICMCVVCDCVWMHACMCVCARLFICLFVCLYIYGNPPHELPTLVLYRKCRVKTAFPAGPDSVSLKNYRKQTQISRERVCQLIHVRREVRILYLSRTTEINLTFQQDMSVSSLRFDVSTKSTAALYPPNPKPTLPRENQKTIF